MKSISKVTFGALIALGLFGCPDTNLGKLFFSDNEAALLDGPNNQNFALGDKFDFKVTVVGNKGIVLDNTFTSQTLDTAIANVDSTTFSDGGSPDLDDDSLRVQGTALAAGDVRLEVSNAAGLVDFVNFKVVAADDVLVQPMQFDTNSKISLDSANIFVGSDIQLFTLLRSNATSTNLRGQITGTATSDNAAVAVSLAQDVAFELGEKFIGLANGTEQSLISIAGAATPGAAVLSFSDTAASFLNTIAVNVIDLAPGIVALDVTNDGADQAAPVSFGAIRAKAKLVNGGAEVFGGQYVFVEIPPAGVNLLTLTNSTTTGDFVTFTANQAGTTQVEVSLVDPRLGGQFVEQTIVTVNVQP